MIYKTINNQKIKELYLHERRAGKQITKYKEYVKYYEIDYDPETSEKKYKWALRNIINLLDAYKYVDKKHLYRHAINDKFTQKRFDKLKDDINKIDGVIYKNNAISMYSVETFKLLKNSFDILSHISKEREKYDKIKHNIVFSL
jgi:hypothetical protein